jgi:hypothetical protein
MRYGVGHRPEREPDVVFPQEEGFNEVKIWIAERVFCIDNNYRSTINSETLDLREEKDPMVYITATSRYDASELENYERGEIARAFLAKLDSILVGELDGLS